MNKEIFISLVLKGLNILINLLSIPLIINYLGSESYGVYITFSSFLGIGSILDFGLGDNLRLGISKNYHKENLESLRVLISTTYVFMSIIGVLSLIVFLLIEVTLGWESLLNVNQAITHEIRVFVIVTVVIYSVKSVLGLIHRIFLGLKLANNSTALSLISSIVSYLTVLLVLENFNSSLINYSLFVGIFELVLLSLFSLYFFHKEWNSFKPSFEYVRFKNTRLFQSKFYYFVLSLTGFLVLNTDNFLISHIFSPSDVSTYYIAFKLFNISSIIFTVIQLPIFANYTERYLIEDFDWIRTINRRLFIIWLGLSLLILIILFFSQEIIQLWFGGAVSVSKELCVTMAIYFIIREYKSISSLFLSGIGKLKILSINATISTVTNIPLSFLFAIYFDMGLKGVILGTIVSIIPELIFNQIQYYNLINRT
ncbi:MAG: hypothetical protein JXQ96_08165 [Cyclobacteriaceae bacterium]